MANPVTVACPAGQWTKVATNQTSGLVHIMNIEPDAYYQTYRDTGGAAPTDLSDAVVFGKTAPLAISASAGIDVYIWCVGAAGKVRVDL